MSEQLSARKLSRPPQLVTPYRIIAACARMRRTFASARNDAVRVFGADSAAWEALQERIGALCQAASREGLDSKMPMGVARLMLDLAHVAPRVERVHTLACWLGAVAQSIEGEDRRAAALAVSLGTIVAESELISAGCAMNTRRLEAA